MSTVHPPDGVAASAVTEASPPWHHLIGQVESLTDLPLDEYLLERLASQGQGITRDIHFYTPTFKSFETSELTCQAATTWPAISVTGSDCRLHCDHCRAELLKPMIPARTPETLWAVVSGLAEAGAKGMLLTGGSNVRNEVDYTPFYSVLERIKTTWPLFRIAVHTALMDGPTARALANAGADIAMMDVIGAQETITQVYHLRRSVADFEATLEALVATSMKVVPHIVLGLHYGQLKGEWQALEIVARHRPAALVLVVIMPFYASLQRPFITPDPTVIGDFLLTARRRLPDIPLLLGCARPPGQTRTMIDTYATLAGVDGIAHPAEGIVELAVRLGRRARVTPACCSVAVGGELLELANGAESARELTLADLLTHQTIHAPSPTGTPVHWLPRPTL